MIAENEGALIIDRALIARVRELETEVESWRDAHAEHVRVSTGMNKRMEALLAELRELRGPKDTSRELTVARFCELIDERNLLRNEVEALKVKYSNLIKTLGYP